MERQKAEELLSLPGNRVGSFLVRESGRERGEYSTDSLTPTFCKRLEHCLCLCIGNETLVKKGACAHVMLRLEQGSKSQGRGMLT